MDYLFISDFDGTLSRKDFYWIIIDDYIGEEGKRFYLDWKAKHKIDVPFLNKVFTWHDFTDQEHDEILDKVVIDEDFHDFDLWCQEHAMGLKVLSAGFDYYIKKVFDKRGLSHLEVLSNPGIFEGGHFVIKPDPNSWFYHDVYGVDKEIVVKHYKESYKKVFFAGDSEPDFKAAMAADLCFAKDELAALLRREGHPFYEFDHFSEISTVLEKLMKDGDL